MTYTYMSQSNNKSASPSISQWMSQCFSEDIIIVEQKKRCKNNHSKDLPKSLGSLSLSFCGTARPLSDEAPTYKWFSVSLLARLSRCSEAHERPAEWDPECLDVQGIRTWSVFRPRSQIPNVTMWAFIIISNIGWHMLSFMCRYVNLITSISHRIRRVEKYWKKIMIPEQCERCKLRVPKNKKNLKLNMKITKYSETDRIMDCPSGKYFTVFEMSHHSMWVPYLFVWLIRL